MICVAQTWLQIFLSFCDLTLVTNSRTFVRIWKAVSEVTVIKFSQIQWQVFLDIILIDVFVNMMYSATCVKDETEIK